MTSAIIINPALAPPDDPVRAALADPGVHRRLLAHACSILHCRLTDAEEVVQIVCERALERRHTFDPARATVTGWLFGFAVNVCREKVRRRGPAATDPTVLAAVAAPDPDSDLADVRFRVERHLRKLSAEDQAVVRLSYLDDLSLQEVAARLNIGYAAARMRLSRAMRRLQGLAADAPREERS